MGELSGTGHRRHTVLMVDDDEQVVKSLSELLSRDGHDVITATSGAAALECLQKTVPCMALLDVTMPGMNGLVLCQRMKHDPRTADIPVALVTGQIETTDVDAGLAAGAIDYIKKPFDPDELRVRVRAQIGLHEKLRAQRRTEERLSLIWRTAKDAIIIIDNEGAITNWNDASSAMFGYTQDEAIGRNLHALIGPKRFHEAHSSAFARYAHTGQGNAVGRTMELAALRKSGEEFPVDLSLSATNIDGKWCAIGIVRDISERVRASKALQASEARYRASFDDASVGQALVALDGSLVEVNSALASMLGYEMAELCGKNFVDLTHLEDRAESAIAMKSLLDGQRIIRLEKRYLRKDGSVLWVDVNVATLRNPVGELTQFLTHVIDVSEQKRIEEKLRNEEMAAKESGQFLNAILNAVPLPMFYVDLDCRFLDANKAHEDFSGRTREDVVGKTVFDLFPRELAELYHKKDLELLQCPGVQAFETPTRDARGAIRDVILHKATFTDRNGRICGILGALMDITDRKYVEAELAHARKLEAVGQLAAGIAHEINTPSQFVGDGIYFMKEAFESCRPLMLKYRSAADALERTGANAELVAEIREMENEIDLDYILANVPGSFDRCIDGISRISTIVRAMKEFSHPGQRDKSPADLNQALHNTLIIAKNEYKYVAEVATELGDVPQVMCHLGDLNQVFLNLIVNAAHAIGDVIDKEKEKGQIRISTVREDDWVCIDISDTGGGIPAGIRDRIFEPFFTTKQVGKGSGQGLAIARSIVVDKHGGTLTFTSQMGKGTTFAIRLPIDGKASVSEERP